MYFCNYSNQFSQNRYLVTKNNPRSTECSLETGSDFGVSNFGNKSIRVA